MNAQRRTGSVIGLILLIATTMACVFPLAGPQATKSTPTATPGLVATLPFVAGTATPTAALSAGGSSGLSGGNNGGGNGGTGGNNGGNNGGSNGDNGDSSNTIPTQLIEINAGPYVVNQIETLGGEAISGSVCSLTQPFSVLSVTSKVTFSFNFVPQDAQHGKVSYAYSIKSAGESHDATGNYTLNPVDKGGTLQLSMTVSDHVVFKGFDGNIPNRYKFNMVPSSNTSCPASP